MLALCVLQFAHTLVQARGKTDKDDASALMPGSQLTPAQRILARQTRKLSLRFRTRSHAHLITRRTYVAHIWRSENLAHAMKVMERMVNQVCACVVCLIVLKIRLDCA